MSDADLFGGSIADYFRWQAVAEIRSESLGFPGTYVLLTSSMEATMSKNRRPVDVIAEHNCGHVPPCIEHLRDADALVGKLATLGWDIVDRDQAAAPDTAEAPTDQKAVDRAKVEGILGQPAAPLDSTAKLYDDLAPENITKPTAKTAPAERADTLQQ